VKNRTCKKYTDEMFWSARRHKFRELVTRIYNNIKNALAEREVTDWIRVT
jgi:hypothetical protein